MKERLKRVLPNNRFARSVSVLAGGTALGQAITVAASPLLTRLYSPEDFGLLAVFAGVLGTVGVVASLRYQLAIPLPESDEEAASVTVLSLLIVLCTTLLSAILLWLWGEALTEVLNTPELMPYLWLLPAGLLLMGIYQVFNFWAIRTKSFPAIAQTKLAQALGKAAVQLGGYALGPLALLLGNVAGHGAGSASLATQAMRNRWDAFRNVDTHDVMWAANRYRRFPLYSSWGGIFNSAGVQLPPVLFAALFSPAAAGIYMLAHRVLSMPMQLLGRAIADVFFSSATEARREGQLAPLVAGIHANLAHIAMPPALILVLAGPDLFGLVFGADWRQAGEFARWMAPWLYLVFVTSPLSQLFSVLEKQAHGMAFQGTLLATRIGSLILGAQTGDLMLTVALFTIGSAVCWIGFLVWMIRASGNTYQALLQPSLRALALSVLLVAPVGLHYMVADGFVVWLAALVLSAVLIATRYTILLKKAW